MKANMKCPRCESTDLKYITNHTYYCGKCKLEKYSLGNLNGNLKYIFYTFKYKISIIEKSSYIRNIHNINRVIDIFDDRDSVQIKDYEVPFDATDELIDKLLLLA